MQKQDYLAIFNRAVEQISSLDDNAQFLVYTSYPDSDIPTEQFRACGFEAMSLENAFTTDGQMLEDEYELSSMFLIEEDEEVNDEFDVTMSKSEVIDALRDSISNVERQECTTGNIFLSLMFMVEEGDLPETAHRHTGIAAIDLTESTNHSNTYNLIFRFAGEGQPELIG